MPRNRTRRPRILTTPAARTQAPGRSSRYAAVPWTGTERLLALTPTPEDGQAFIRSFDWNPGLASTFSVGHRQAESFNKYEMTGYNSVDYTPACSTLTPGSLYVLFDYNPNEPAPSTQDEFGDNELTKTCALYGNMTARLDLRQIGNCKLLIRRGPIVSDLMVTDPCKVHIGAFGYGTDAIGSTLGHFHVNYSATLMIRQPIPAAPVLARNALSITPVEGFVPSGTSDVGLAEPALNTIGSVVSANSFTLPTGAYNIHLQLGVSLDATPTSFFLSAELRKNGNRVDGSPSVFQGSTPNPLDTTLTSSLLISAAQGDVFTYTVVHDRDSNILVVADRSLITALLV